MRRAVPLAMIVGCQPAWDEDRFLDRYSAAVCAQEVACDADSWLLALGTEACEEEVAAGAVPALTSDCRTFDAAGAEACARAVEQAGCEEREAQGEGPLACAELLDGTRCAPVPGFVGVARAGSYAARVRSVRPRRWSGADPR